MLHKVEVACKYHFSSCNSFVHVSVRLTLVYVSHTHTWFINLYEYLATILGFGFSFHLAKGNHEQPALILKVEPSFGSHVFSFVYGHCVGCGAHQLSLFSQICNHLYRPGSLFLNDGCHNSEKTSTSVLTQE